MRERGLSFKEALNAGRAGGGSARPSAHAVVHDARAVLGRTRVDLTKALETRRPRSRTTRSRGGTAEGR